MTRPLLAWLCLAAALFLWGCPGSLENPDRFEGGTGGCDAEMLLASSCGANAICHDDDAPQGGLDLVSAGVASRVLDVAPGLCTSSDVYVSSADPMGASFLLEKINPTPGCGTQMPPPPETPLTAAEITCITDWVVAIGGGATGDSGMPDAAMDVASDAAADAADGAMP